MPSKKEYSLSVKGLDAIRTTQSFHISPKMEKKIDKLIPNIFPHKAEFYRYLIIKFFSDNPEWFK